MSFRGSVGTIAASGAPMDSERPTEMLVAAARAGDRGAFASLIARHRDLVFAYALARLRDREDAEDVAQETFVRAYTALERLRSAAIWEGWLLRIARNLCHDRLRRRRVRRTEPIDPAWLDGGPSPESILLTGERRRQLQAAVQALPELYRVPLLMRFESGCSRRDIATALAVPESTVMGRLARAVRLLRQSLGEEI